MKKKIAVLGSTGSIGMNTLKIIKDDIKNFQVELLSTNKNIKKIYIQSKLFNVKNILISDKISYLNSYNFFKKKKINTYNLIDEFLKKNKIKFDYTMSSISGLDGLEPTLKIIKFTKNIAIANKETIICGWNLIKKKLDKYKTVFIPVDSEHFSINELLKNSNINNVRKIYITASGGPFLNLNPKQITKLDSNKAIQHPTWKMGKKISVDSSTLMNKVFEVVEAKKIFNLPLSIFDIVVQPTSYVHGIVEFKNGFTKFLTHPTSMKIPIFSSIYSKDKIISKFEKIDFKKLNNLSFQSINYKNFPINKILKKIPNKDTLFETVLVTANDTLVEKYLNNQIKFYEIYDILVKILNSKEFIKFNKIKPKNLNQIINLSNKVRLKTQSLSVISKKL